MDYIRLDTACYKYYYFNANLKLSNFRIYVRRFLELYNIDKAFSISKGP